ncbi:hypothetical protein HWC53_gp110 [Bacillus phage vB_BmeM-Goe8]|uniref:Uncharacterized protein n=1 Tax=Bacillus phage vB_BmeM-Goe8 TaxID=2593638 RepID=A0A516KN02_9CAUD|nr:hypothetical protein HWC53_gp110 [Bacillus phage vB_BmeM-Goe8]QDP42979.1 hypothetical protein Goe8_c02060 [Bacillus phage vB_BmeM-Goe8]
MWIVTVEIDHGYKVEAEVHEFATEEDALKCYKENEHRLGTVYLAEVKKLNY